MSSKCEAFSNSRAGGRCSLVIHWLAWVELEDRSGAIRRYVVFLFRT